MKWIAALILMALVVVALVVVALVVLGSLARTNGDGGAPGAASRGTAEVVLEEMRFTPNRIDARVGQPLTLRLVNRGSQRHDLNFPSLHMPGLEGAEAILEPGETRTLTLRFDQPGEHAFQCTLPGHAAAGMTGAVFVRS
jgi:nitrite reductase (NO-forming)